MYAIRSYYEFNTYDATIETDDDDFKKVTIAFSADINSVDTNNDDRDNHLKSADFFDGEKFPKLSFKATSLTPKSYNFV